MMQYAAINAYLTDERTPPYVPTLLPIAILMVLTALLPDIPAYTAMMLSLWPYYRLTAQLQARYFACSRTTAHLQLVMPLYTLLTVWGLFLVLDDRATFLLGCVGPFTFVVLTAMWPVFRHNLGRNARRIPYRISYSLAATLFVIAASVNIWRNL